MEFEDIQMIWDSQENAPLYTINEQSLNKRILKDETKARHGLNMLEISSMLILFSMGIAVGMEPILDHHDYHQWLYSVVYISIAIWVYRQREMRLKAEAMFEPGLLGDLNRSISVIDSHIERCRGFFRWVMGPIALMTAISYPFYYDSKPIWIWPALLLCILGTFQIMKHTIKKDLEPKRQSLQSLRDKLSSPDH